MSISSGAQAGRWGTGTSFSRSDLAGGVVAGDVVVGSVVVKRDPVHSGLTAAGPVRGRGVRTAIVPSPPAIIRPSSRGRPAMAIPLVQGSVLIDGSDGSDGSDGPEPFG
jgi:hypothetical protein